MPAILWPCFLSNCRSAWEQTCSLLQTAKVLPQIYFDRWPIEVNHREEKETPGVGQAQL